MARRCSRPYKRLLKLREGNIAEGKIPALQIERIRFEELAQDFLDDYIINGRNSLKRAERSVKQLRRHFGGLRVIDITTPGIQRFILDRQQAGLENGSINRELSALKRMLNLGIRQTPPKVVNLPYVPKLRENNVRKGYFEHHEFIRLFHALPDYLRPVLVIGYFTGMRLGEILSLRWEQVDLAERMISLEAGTTKNNEARVIFMPESLFFILWERRRLRDAEFPECPDVCFRNGL